MTTKTEAELKQRQERYLTKVEQIDNRLSLMKARQNSKQRKADTRVKILIGSLMMKHWRDNGTLDENCTKLLAAMRSSLSDGDVKFLQKQGFNVEL